MNVTTTIEKLDESGYVHLPTFHLGLDRLGLAVPGLARMEYTFTPVGEGTLDENALILGGSSRWEHFVTRLLVPAGHAELWIRHDIEEVGALKHFVPTLYRRETGRAV